MRKMSKYFITAFVLTVLMAIFAFSASAATTREVTSQDTWDSAISVMANSDAINVRGGTTEANTLTITVDGTDIVKGCVEVYGYVKFVGVNDGKISYKRSGTGYTAVNIAKDAVVTFENITLSNDTGTTNRVLRARDSSKIIINEGTVITKGNSSGGGGLYVSAGAIVEFNGGLFTDNSTATYGGAVSVGTSGTFIMNGGTISNNVSKGTGGSAIYMSDSSTFKMNGGTIENNTTIVDSSKTGNDFYGALYNYGGSSKVVITGGTFSGNKITKDGQETVIGRGSAIAIRAGSASFSMSGATITDNVGYEGVIWSYGRSVSFGQGTLICENEGVLGTINIYSGVTLTIEDGVVIKNNVAKRGGAIYNAGTVVMNGGTISGNTAATIGTDYARGGAVYNTGTFGMYGGIISDNISERHGGGVYTVGGTFNMYGGTISGNRSYGQGAAIYCDCGTINIAEEQNKTVIIRGNVACDASGNYQMGSALRSIGGTVTISGAEITGNKGGYGGIVSSTYESSVANLTMTDCSYTNNETGRSDGYACVYAMEGKMTIKNCTFEGNISTDSGTGGAIKVASGETTVENTVISGNKAGKGGGIYVEGGTVSLIDVTITGNEAKYGGGIYSGECQISLEDVEIIGNVASSEAAGLRYGSYTKITLSGATKIIGNALTDNTINNIQGSTGFMSYDAEDYKNLPTASTGWIVIDGEFTGNVGVYFPAALPVSMNFDAIKLGVIAENGSMNGTISNDNGKFVYAQGTDAKCNACITMAVTQKVDFEIKLASGGSQTFTVAEYDYYTLPTADEFTAEGYFLGYVKVSGYGTENAKAEAIISGKDKYTAAELTAELKNLYATFVKVNTLAAASANVSENSGLRFVTTVDSGVLANVGLNAKAEGTEGNGYIRGMVLGTSATDMSENLGVNHCKLNKVIANDGWMTAEKYNQYTKQTLADGQSAYAFTLTYSNEENYNKAVAFRGYIVITVGEQKVWIYSEFKNPGTMTDSDDATYGNVHARSARAVVRNVYFKGDYQTKEDVIAKIGESNYAIALKIAGLEEFAILPKNSL